MRQEYGSIVVDVGLIGGALCSVKRGMDWSLAGHLTEGAASVGDGPAYSATSNEFVFF